MKKKMKTEEIHKKFRISPDTAVFTTKFVVEEKQEITYVTHDSDDGAWQFFSNESFEDYKEVARIIRLDEIIEIDSSVIDLAEMPEGFVATRLNKKDKWKIEKKE